MEFNSPRPEHAQLQGNGTLINPKSTSRLLSSLNERIAATQHISGDKNQPREQCQNNESRFTLIAPRAVSARDASLYENVDEYLIPSPPLSPMEPTQLQTGDAVAESRTTVAIDNVDALVKSARKENDRTHLENVPGLCTKGAWDNYKATDGTRRYKLHIYAFLSQYKILKPNLNKSGNSTGSRYWKRTRGTNRTYASGSDLEKVYRTRRVTGGSPASTKGDSDEDSISQLPRVNTPVRRKKQVHPSPLSHSIANTTPNMSWEKLPDYSPSLNTLPANNNKCLKVDWKGSSMDLSADPLKDKLHPAELLLAQILRLPCDLYLDSKRRFFIEKVHRLKQNMPFRRTDAQKACRIDVNKASRLYAAYEKIGWLSDAHFKKFL